VTRTLPTVAEARQTIRQADLLADLADLSQRVDEAQHELELGTRSGDLYFAAAGARRIQSLGFLMGDLVRRYEKANRR
jgi:hypothetical protein